MTGAHPAPRNLAIVGKRWFQCPSANASRAARAASAVTAVPVARTCLFLPVPAYLSRMSCVFFSPSPRATRIAPGATCSRNAGVNHSF